VRNTPSLPTSAPGQQNPSPAAHLACDGCCGGAPPFNISSSNSEGSSQQGQQQRALEAHARLWSHLTDVATVLAGSRFQFGLASGVCVGAEGVEGAASSRGFGRGLNRWGGAQVGERAVLAHHAHAHRTTAASAHAPCARMHPTRAREERPMQPTCQEHAYRWLLLHCRGLLCTGQACAGGAGGRAAPAAARRQRGGWHSSLRTDTPAAQGAW